MGLLKDFGNWLYDNVPIVQSVTDVISNVGEGILDIATGGQRSANQTNQNIANQNIDFQQRENEIIRAREDNAVQRAALDMEAAGLSKTLAAGSPASATVTTAPHNDYQAQKLNYLGGMLDLKQKIANIQQTQINNDLAYKQFEVERSYKNSLINYNNSQSALNASNTVLTDLKSANYVREVDASINKILSETNLNWSKVLTDGEYRKLLKQEAMTEIKKQSWYDNEALVQTWNYLDKYMDYKIDEYNLGLYQGVGMPTNMNSGLPGLVTQSGIEANLISNQGGLSKVAREGLFELFGKIFGI